MLRDRAVSVSRAPSTLISNVQFWVDGLLGPGYMSRSLLDLVDLAYTSVDSVFREAEAVQWADGFVIPKSVVAEGVRLFDGADRDFSKMVGCMKTRLAGGRMSVESVNSVISDSNPEKLKLFELVGGMKLLLEGSFVPNGRSRPLLSAAYRRVAPAVNKMMFEDFVEKGLAVVLPVSLVEEFLPNFHVSRLSWTPKSGKEKGRPILDCSAGVQSLNSPMVKTACNEMWGSISHPGIDDLVRMVWAFWKSSGVGWDELILWKVDLKGAYTLLSFEDEAVPLVGAEMTDGLIIFFLCGVFGWTGTPASFQVVSRALKFEIMRRISGAADLYVDDIFGVSRKGEVDADIAEVVGLCRGLFQSDCIETSKTEVGRRVVVIGYVIDLDLGVVSVAEKNLLKVIYGLSSVDLSSKVSVKLMQRFASWISRYSAVCVVLKPLSRTLYQSFAGRSDHVLYELDVAGKRAVQVFRALFLVAMGNEERFTRSIGSFVVVPPSVVVEFDASLEGGGVLWFSVLEESFLGSSAFDFSSLCFSRGSDFQNSAEFLAAVLGLVGVLVLCEPPYVVKF